MRHPILGAALHEHDGLLWLGPAATRPHVAHVDLTAAPPHRVAPQLADLVRRETRRVVISWGRQGSRELPPEASILEVDLSEDNGGTRVSIVHPRLPDSESTRHVVGWQHYLGRLQVAAEGGEPGPHAVPRSLTEGAD